MDAVASSRTTSWHRWGGELGQLLKDHPESGQRQTALAALLRDLVPGAVRAECQFEVEKVNGTSALLSGIVTSMFATGGGGTGRLLVEMPAGTPAEELAHLQELLGLAAHLLERELGLEMLRAEEHEVGDIILVGEAVLGLIHALNNHLNAMTLQAAAVQIRVPEALRGELAGIRREGMAAAARLRPLQAVGPDSDQGSADLRAALAELERRSSGKRGSLLVDVPPGPVLLPVSLVRLVRLLGLLLVIAGDGHSPARGPVRLDLAPRDEGTGFRLFLDGPRVEGEEPARLIHMHLGVEGGLVELRRAAAHGLARRLGGHIHVRNREGGVVISVVWPAR